MRVLQVDITTLAVDAIVNAANVSLLGGGGVDRAIHEAAGPGLLEECRRLGGCAVGNAKATAGHGLPARWVFHAVGPIWEGGEAGEAELLAGCHRRCIELANERGVASIAFPAISCGAFGYPADRAAAVAVAAVRAALDRGSTVEDVVFAVFGSATETAYRAAVAAL